MPKVLQKGVYHDQLQDQYPGLSLSFFSAQLCRALKFARRPASPWPSPFEPPSR
jgi:hypothetical protein